MLEWQGGQDFEDAAKGVDDVYTLAVPVYALGRAFSSLYRNAHFNMVCADKATQEVICEVSPDRARYCCKGQQKPGPPAPNTAMLQLLKTRKA